MLKSTVKLICWDFALKHEKVKYIEDIKSEGALGPCDGWWEVTGSKELNMIYGASRYVIASTELNSNDVDTREINNNKIFLN